MFTTAHACKFAYAIVAETALPDVKTRRQPSQDIVESPIQSASGFIVIVYDNDVNTADEVVMILRKATACTQEEAEIEMWEVHNLGKSVVHHGSKEECERVASIIRTIGIRVEVVED